MSLADKLEKRAEIERLLAENAGRLLRASQLPPRPTTREKQQTLEQLLPNCQRITQGDQTFLISESVVSVFPEDGAQPHTRGYSLCPAPSPEFLLTGLESAGRLADALHLLSGDESLRDIKLDRFAFVDTETTGIAGPSGTYPFLIGLGYFRNSGGGHEFVTEQYFMEDYCHEPAMLAHLIERLGQFDGLVTFNGKTFDIPLLRGRFIMNRMRVDLDRPHLDLLHPARRIFKGRLGSCSLGRIEQEVLGVTRSHDSDGRLIPQLYFDYLRGRRVAELVLVFDHNVQDIISMGALMLHLAGIVFDSSHSALDNAHDLAAVGRLHLRRGSLENASEFHERALLLAREPDVTRAILRSLASVYRKQGRHVEAAEIWRSETSGSKLGNGEAFIELAKICEHRLRDFPAALAAVESAQKQIALAEEMSWYAESGLAPSRNADLIAHLAARQKRLLRKMEKA